MTPDGIALVAKLNDAIAAELTARGRANNHKNRKALIAEIQHSEPAARTPAMETAFKVMFTATHHTEC